MGMAPSQGRFLALTSELHDINLKAQSIMSQKVATATQRDKIYNDYCAALDATKIQVAYRNTTTGQLGYVNANYTALCEYSETRACDYVFKDNISGGIYVTKDVADTYEQYKNDKYTFALIMAGLNPDEIPEYEPPIFENSTTSEEEREDETPPDLGDLLESGEEYERPTVIQKDFDNEGLSEDAFYQYYDTLDSSVTSKIDYYLNLYDAIDSSKGCVVMDSENVNGQKGEEWFTNMVNAGLITIQVYGGNYGNESKGWQDTSVATSINENYMQEVHDDTDEKKAEAEYNQKLDMLSDKDATFDTTLKNLEVRKSAIEQEMEGLKTVIKDNIERTFKFDS